MFLYECLYPSYRVESVGFLHEGAQWESHSPAFLNSLNWRMRNSGRQVRIFGLCPGGKFDRTALKFSIQTAEANVITLFNRNIISLTSFLLLSKTDLSAS